MNGVLSLHYANFKPSNLKTFNDFYNDHFKLLLKYYNENGQGIVLDNLLNDIDMVAKQKAQKDIDFQNSITREIKRFEFFNETLEETKLKIKIIENNVNFIEWHDDTSPHKCLKDSFK